MILQTQTSDSAPPLPEKDGSKEQPPPYTPGPEQRTRTNGLPPPPPRPSIMPSPGASVSQVHVFSKKEDIIGTFHIDPWTPSTIGEGLKMQTKHGKKKSRKGKGKGNMDSPHASFQTRSGSMKLQVATTTNGIQRQYLEKEQARVFVGSRSGKVEITVLPRNRLLQGEVTEPFMGLDVFSRSGNVIIYLPETFSGVLRAESTKGEIKFLPALARGMRLLKSTEREQMATLGEGQGDLCEVFTRSGRIVLGLAGRDDYKEEPGFWKKLFA